MMRVMLSTQINVEKKVTVMATVLFASTLLIARCIDVSFTFHLLHSFLALIVSCCRFSSHTIKHSPVRCTSTFVSGQAIRFTMSKCWLSTPSSNYMVARWTTFRKNYRNGKVFLATQFVSLNFLYFCVWFSFSFRFVVRENRNFMK